MCDERERLIGYVYDECGDEERGLVDEHLESCETCREEISGLRATRQDLLAWEVPDHGSVWKPFVPARVTPWYREVPAWAMAAAAGVMVVLGLSGGMVGQQLLAARAATPAPVTIASSSVDDVARRAELIALERRIADSMRADLAQLDQRVKLVSQQHATTGLVHASDSDTTQDMALYNSVNTDMYRMSLRMRSIENQLEGLRQLIVTQQSGSGLNR
jgi:anti-sigma factor RsiW